MKKPRPLLLVIASISILAAIWFYVLLSQPPRQTLDQRVHGVASQLKCLVCQGESVADSPALLSQQMRSIIRQQLQSGKSEQEVIQYFQGRYGGYIVHLGFVLLAIGVIGSHFFQSQQDAVLKPGQQISLAGYQLVYFGNVDLKYPGVEIITAQLQVWHDGQLQQYIYPGRDFYPNFGNQPASIISITTHNLTDLYVFLADWNGPSQATIRVFVNPLVPLVWLGGLLMLLGGITCWWPERRKRKPPTTLEKQIDPHSSNANGHVNTTDDTNTKVPSPEEVIP